MELARQKSVKLLLLDLVYLIFFIGLSYSAFYAYKSYSGWLAVFAMLFAFAALMAFLSRRKSEIALAFLSCFDLRWRGLFDTVLLPALLVIMLHKFVLQFSWITTVGGNLFGAIFFGSLMQPFLEEVLYRGILLGGSTVFVKIILSKAGFKLTENLRLLINLVALIATSAIFVLDHSSGSILVFALSLIYGSLYLANDRNLLPAYFAHLVNNLLVILYNPYLFFV